MCYAARALLFVRGETLPRNENGKVLFFFCAFAPPPLNTHLRRYPSMHII